MIFILTLNIEKNIYESDYIKINANIRLYDLLDYFNSYENLFGIDNLTNNIDFLDLDKNITLMECILNESIRLLILPLLLSLDAFIELESFDYERTVLAKQFIKSKNKIDLKENETIKDIIIAKIYKNSILSFDSIFYNNKLFVNSVYLKLDENNIGDILIGSYDIKQAIKRNLNIELSIINKKIDIKLVDVACRLNHILMPKCEYKNDFDIIISNYILKKNLHKCIGYVKRQKNNKDVEILIEQQL